MPKSSIPNRLLLRCLLLLVTVQLHFAICNAQEDIRNVEATNEHRFFENHVRPLLAKHCYQCHSDRENKREGNLTLDQRSGWLQGGDHGPPIVPGDVEASILIHAVRYTNASLQMPPTRALSTEEVHKLEQWVRMGAKAPTEVTHGTDDPSDPIQGKEHWAFQPLRISLPSSDSRNESTNLIDHYLDVARTLHGVHRNGIASRRILSRRLYIQLTGLPPTAEQLHGFLNDDNDDAYSNLIDQLLSSPRFGERWGRHWLDLARYADSNGLDENFLFREAWRYRTWVIDAINDDMPFDRFVTMQLAGDLLPYASIAERDRQRIATGFLLVGPKVLLGNDERNQRMEIADEQIDTVGRALLGQTLGCARCHNHKFDPIPTADYYALAGIFASTKVMERRYMLGEQRLMERLVGLHPEGEALDESYEEYWRQQPKRKADKKQAESILEALKKDNPDEFARMVESSDAPVAAESRDLSKSIAARIEAQKAIVAALMQQISNPPAIPPRAMIPCDVDEPADEHIRIAGQFDQLGKKVPRGFLTVLSRATASQQNLGNPEESPDASGTDRTRIWVPPKSSGRIELSHWITDTQKGAGALTARVLANRIWYHMLGRGIVRTVDNFGRTGEPPSHPELLDYLADELVRSGWSIKHLVRLIALSKAFQLSSDLDETNFAVDPENRMLWRAHRRRMDPESFRDSMLLSADKLDLTPMQSSVAYLGDQATAVGQNKIRRRTDFPCRSVYLPIIRNDLPELFDILDFANPHATTGLRPNTTVPAQGLYLLNDVAIMDAAMAIAKRAVENAPTGDRKATIQLAFDWIVGAPANAEQLQAVERFVNQLAKQTSSTSDDDQREHELTALAMACHAIFASSRFQYIE